MIESSATLQTVTIPHVCQCHFFFFCWVNHAAKSGLTVCVHVCFCLWNILLNISLTRSQFIHIYIFYYSTASFLVCANVASRRWTTTVPGWTTVLEKTTRSTLYCSQWVFNHHCTKKRCYLSPLNLYSHINHTLLLILDCEYCWLTLVRPDT